MQTILNQKICSENTRLEAFAGSVDAFTRGPAWTENLHLATFDDLPMGHLSQCQAFTTHCSVIKGRPKKIIKLEDDLLGIYAILGGPSEIPLVFCSKKPPGKILRDSYPH